MTEHGRVAASDPGLSVVIPARDEGEQITSVLDRLLDIIRTPCEVLVIVDGEAETTTEVLRRYECTEPRLTCLVSNGRAGRAGAIRLGFQAARAPVIIVTRADGSDDPAQIDHLAALIHDGAVIAAVSRSPARSLAAYSAEFVRSVGIDSRRGFDVGHELTAKARRLRLPVAEVPVLLPGREAAASGFRSIRWLPGYLRWYLFSFGWRPDPGQMHALHHPE